jgi:hypothetical protein
VTNQKKVSNFGGQAHSHVFQAGSKIRVVITNFDWASEDSSFMGPNPFVLPSLKNGNHKIFLYNQSYIDFPIETTAPSAPGTMFATDEPNLNTPYEFSLSQNYPNPFNPVTTINYTLASSGKVELKVYDILGREVQTLVNDIQNAGSHTVNFNAVNLSSGVYFYRITSGNFSDIKKMVLVK